MEPLLQLLERDARYSPATLSRLLGIDEEAVKRKIAAFEAEGVILGYRAVINHDKTDAERVKAVIEVRISPERDGGFDRTAERIAKFEEVHACFLMSGGFDLLIFVEGRTLHEVASFVASKLATLERVQSTATHFMLKTYKEQSVLMTAATVEERLAVAP